MSLGSGGEIGYQLYKEFGAGKLDGVNFQGATADEAQHDGHGLWRLDTAWAALKQAQARGQDAELKNKDDEMDPRKRKFDLFLPNEDYRRDKAGQQAHQVDVRFHRVRGRC